MMRLICDAKIVSAKSLEDVASLVSERILGGIRFIGREKNIYDEVPAIYGERPILGLRVVLQGYGGKQPYFLEMRDCRPLDPTLSPDQIRESVVDISDLVARLLEGIEGITVSIDEDRRRQTGGGT